MKKLSKAQQEAMGKLTHEYSVSVDKMVALYRDMAPILHYVTDERCIEGILLYSPGGALDGEDFVLLHPSDLITLRAELHGIHSLVRVGPD